MTSAGPTLSRHRRNLFFGGLVVPPPIVLTVNALVWPFRFVDGLAAPVVLGRAVPGIGFVTTVGVVLTGRRVGSASCQRAIARTPRVPGRREPCRTRRGEPS